LQMYRNCNIHKTHAATVIPVRYAVRVLTCKIILCGTFPTLDDVSSGNKQHRKDN
jgi:hypothetical protein